MTYPVGGNGPSTGAGEADSKSGGLDNIPPSGHASLGPNDGVNFLQGRFSGDADRDNGLPDVARYEGPMVSDQAPMVNPSAGMRGPAGGGVNPQGAAPTAGTGPVSDRVVYPDTTQDRYPR